MIFNVIITFMKREHNIVSYVPVLPVTYITFVTHMNQINVIAFWQLCHMS